MQNCLGIPTNIRNFAAILEARTWRGHCGSVHFRPSQQKVHGYSHRAAAHNVPRQSRERGSLYWESVYKRFVLGVLKFSQNYRLCQNEATVDAYGMFFISVLYICIYALIVLMA